MMPNAIGVTSAARAIAISVRRSRIISRISFLKTISTALIGGRSRLLPSPKGGGKQATPPTDEGGTDRLQEGDARDYSRPAHADRDRPCGAGHADRVGHHLAGLRPSCDAGLHRRLLG